MALQTSGPISINNIKTQFGGDASPALSEFYAGGAFVSAGTRGVNGAIPTSGQINISDFYGAPMITPMWKASNTVSPLTYTYQGISNVQYFTQFPNTAKDNAGNIIKVISYLSDYKYSFDQSQASYGGIGVYKFSNNGTTLLWKTGIFGYHYSTNVWNLPQNMPHSIDSAGNIYVPYSFADGTVSVIGLMKISPSGAISWNKNYQFSAGNGFCNLRFSIDSNDTLHGMFCLTNGTTSVPYVYAIINAADGSLSSAIQIDVSSSQNRTNVELAETNGNVAVNYHTTTDQSGNQYLGTLYSMAGLTSGNYIYDRIYLSKVSTSGFVWQISLKSALTLSGTVGYAGFSDLYLACDSSNNVYGAVKANVGATDSITGTTYIYVFKVNTSGTLQWMKRIQVPLSSELMNLTGCTVLPNGTVHLVASINTSTAGGGGGGGGDSSVSVTAYLPSGKQAGNAVPGDELVLLSTDRTGTMPGVVVSNRVSRQQIVKLVSSSGIELTCSTTTPLTLQDGSCISVFEVLNKELPVEDENGFRWEPIVEVQDAGYGDVATIYCENQCYAAGDVFGKYIWTHNLINTKN
jgi:hypothetical protein